MLFLIVKIVRFDEKQMVPMPIDEVSLQLSTPDKKSSSRPHKGVYTNVPIPAYAFIGLLHGNRHDPTSSALVRAASHGRVILLDNGDVCPPFSFL